MVMPTHILAVGGFVENELGKIILVKTQHEGWVFPGGQVEVGENLIDALVREIKEESGLDVIVLHMVGAYSNTAQYKWHDGITNVPTKLMLDFTCQPVGGELTTSEETSEVKWVEKEYVLDYISHPAIRTRYQKYLEFTGQVTYMEYITKPQFEVRADRNV